MLCTLETRGHHGDMNGRVSYDELARKHRPKRGPLAHDDISTMRAPTYGVRAQQVKVSSSIDSTTPSTFVPLAFSEPLHVARDSWPLASTVSHYNIVNVEKYKNTV